MHNRAAVWQEGAGNDFVLGVGAWAGRLDSEPDLVRRLCDRRRGIGADGTLSLTAVGAGRVRLGYRNADGGEAVFCANGTRCAARAAVELLGCDPMVVVETGWAEVPAVVDGSQVSLELPPPEAGPRDPVIAAPEGAAPGSGNPLRVPAPAGFRYVQARSPRAMCSPHIAARITASLP